MTISEIEDKVAAGEMSAAQVFTQMCQKISKRDEALRGIAEMPEYDQDDAHRLRHIAKQFLSANTEN